MDDDTEYESLSFADQRLLARIRKALAEPNPDALMFAIAVEERNRVYHTGIEKGVELLTAGAFTRIRQLSTGNKPSRQLPLEALGLSIRVLNALKGEGWHIVGDVIDLSTERLLDVRQFSERSLDELERALVSAGYRSP